MFFVLKTALIFGACVYNHTAVFLNIQKVGDNEIQMYSKYMALDKRHIDKYCCLFIYKLKYNKHLYKI